MTPESHDDGLVHTHDWARERPRSPAPRNAVASAMNAHPAQREFDDGLVHSHGWACGERGRPRHG